jgi:carboxymethylenebutenolidase
MFGSLCTTIGKQDYSCFPYNKSTNRAAVHHKRGTAAGLLVVIATSTALAQEKLPQRVDFFSTDGRTKLVGYVFAPSKHNAPFPAVVPMHGRAGAYSSLAHGRYEAMTLSKRHQMWGQFWSAQGYVAVLVDGFGPRGYPQGFPRFSYGERPEELDEVLVRPLDAYGGLAYLRTRPDIAPDRVGLMGWSNGGSATLASMAPQAPGLTQQMQGFAAALAFYPGCGLKHRLEADYKPYAPMRVFMGDADEEVSSKLCVRIVEQSQSHGGDIRITLYPGATHDFDDPSRKRQELPANSTAKADSMIRAQQFFAEQLQH